MKDFLNLAFWLEQLIFPDLCLICRGIPKAGNHLFCVPCLVKLPFSEIADSRKNALKEKFWGRVCIEEAAALFLFQENGHIQQLIHKIKYKNRPDIAAKLGACFGKRILSYQIFQSIDLITAVPLHPDRKKTRGFNQSEEFGRAIAVELGVPYKSRVLKRIQRTESQTQKSRMDRILNVRHAFKRDQGDELQDKHVLIVDDIITTGATLEACILELQKDQQLKISIAAIGMSNNKLVN